MSVVISLEKIDLNSNTRKMLEEPVALETPVNILVNDTYVVTLLASPNLMKELTLGWLFDEGVLHSLDEVKQVVVDADTVNVKTARSIQEGLLRVSGVSTLLTTACGLSADKFLRIISDESYQLVESDYKVKADVIMKMVQKLDEGRLFASTGGVHVAALFEKERLVALAEDVGRHNTIDKVVGIGILSKIDFSNSVLVSSGRQPADMVLKAARMGIPIVVSRAAPIRSGILVAEKAGVTLACFVRNRTMNVYTYHRRVITTQ